MIKMNMANIFSLGCLLLNLGHIYRQYICYNIYKKDIKKLYKEVNILYIRRKDKKLSLRRQKNEKI